MTRVQLLANVTTRTMTRVDLCIDTARRFLEIAECHGYDASWYEERLEKFIKHRFLSRLLIYGFAHHPDEPEASIYIDFDWETQDRFYIAFGETIDMSGISGGGTFASISEVLDEAKKYIDTLYRRGVIRRVEVWYTLDNKAVEENGIQKIRNFMDIKITEKESAKNAARYKKIRAALNRGKNQSMVLPDLQEMLVGVWKK